MRFPPFHTGSQQCFVEDMIGLDWIPLDPLRFQNPKKNSTQTLPPRTLPAKKKKLVFLWEHCKMCWFKKPCVWIFWPLLFFQQIPNKHVVFGCFTRPHHIGWEPPLQPTSTGLCPTGPSTGQWANELPATRAKANPP